MMWGRKWEEEVVFFAHRCADTNSSPKDLSPDRATGWAPWRGGRAGGESVRQWSPVPQPPALAPSICQLPSSTAVWRE